METVFCCYFFLFEDLKCWLIPLELGTLLDFGCLSICRLFEGMFIYISPPEMSNRLAATKIYKDFLKNKNKKSKFKIGKKTIQVFFFHFFL